MAYSVMQWKWPTQHAYWKNNKHGTFLQSHSRTSTTSSSSHGGCAPQQNCQRLCWRRWLSACASTSPCQQTLRLQPQHDCRYTSFFWTHHVAKPPRMGRMLHLAQSHAQSFLLLLACCCSCRCPSIIHPFHFASAGSARAQLQAAAGHCRGRAVTAGRRHCSPSIQHCLQKGQPAGSLPAAVPGRVQPGGGICVCSSRARIQGVSRPRGQGAGVGCC